MTRRHFLRALTALGLGAVFAPTAVAGFNLIPLASRHRAFLSLGWNRKTAERRGGEYACESVTVRYPKGVNADQFREKWTPPVPEGFKRIALSFFLSLDRTELTVRTTDWRLAP